MSSIETCKEDSLPNKPSNNYIMLIYSVEKNASMALGEVLGEARGKITGLKALGKGTFSFHSLCTL